MKKQNIILTCAILILTTLLNIYAKPLGDNLEFDPGSFVYYLDTRGTNNRLTGLAYIEKDIFLCRTYDLSSDTEFVVTLSIKKANKGYDIKLQKTLSGEMTQETMQYVLIDFLNISSQYNSANLNKYPEDVFKEDPWPELGYTLVHRFSYWVPIFNLFSTKIKDNESNSYKLVLFGKMNNEDELKSFLKLKTIPEDYRLFENTKKDLSLIIKEAPEKQHISNGTILTLDENWTKMDKSQEMPVEYFIISKFSRRDAQINTEIGDITKFKMKDPLDFFKKSLLIYTKQMDYIFPDSVKIFIKGSKYFMEFEAIDNKTGFVNKMIFGMEKIRNTRYLIITYTSFKEVYDANKEYFNKILNNIKIK